MTARTARRAAGLTVAAFGWLVSTAGAAPPNCAKATGHSSEYKIYFDDKLAHAVERTWSDDPELLQAVAMTLSCHIAALRSCMDGLCMRPPLSVPCPERRPTGEADFPSSGLKTLDRLNVVMEAWVQINPALDSRGRQVERIEFSYLLVPLPTADGPDERPTILTIQRDLPRRAKLLQMEQSLDHLPELRAFTFACAGAQALAGKKYDDAWHSFQLALRASQNLQPAARNAPIQPLRTQVMSLARATARKAHDDAANTSGVGALDAVDLEAILARLQ